MVANLENWWRGELPEDFVKSKTIILPKTGYAVKSVDLFLCYHTVKSRLTVEKIEHYVSENNFGFRSGKGINYTRLY